MRGQLYREHANATALSSRPVVSALGSESDDPGSTPGRGKALCPRDVREKNASSAPLSAWLNLCITDFTSSELLLVSMNLLGIYNICLTVLL